MFKRHSKKVICFSFLIMALFMFVSEVFAATKTTYDFSDNDGGMTIAVESDTKYSGKVSLRASRSLNTRYYRGTYRFVLYKKNILGNYKEYEREFKETYNDCNIVMARANMSKAYYKGTLQLYESDGTDTVLRTTFSIENLT